MATAEFETSGYEWHYETSRALTGSNQPRQPHITGLDAMTVHCKACGARWRAVKTQHGGPGYFVVLSEVLVIVCPTCHHRQGSVERPYPPGL